MAHSDPVTKVTHSKETILVGNALLDFAGEEIRFENVPLCYVLTLPSHKIYRKLLQNISRYVILSDTTVWNLHGERLMRSLARVGLTALVKCTFCDLFLVFILSLLLVLPPGEISKTRQIKEEIEDFMLKEACNRDTCLIGDL